MNLGIIIKKHVKKIYFALAVNIPNHTRTLSFLLKQTNRQNQKKFLRINRTSSIVQLKPNRKTNFTQHYNKRKIYLPKLTCYRTKEQAYRQRTEVF